MYLGNGWPQVASARIGVFRRHRPSRGSSLGGKLRAFEGLSHAQYTINPDAPETREAFEEIARFFDRHMQR